MSLYFDSDKYELATSIETETLLAELPFELLKASIREQIIDPVSTPTNYIDVIVDKCLVYKEHFGDDENLTSEIDKSLSDFFIFIMTEIDNKFDLGLDIDGISASSDIVEVGSALYKYFILRYSKNITKYITKFIFRNKKLFLSEFDSDKSDKDVSTLAYKKQLKNPEDLCIIAHLPDIIKYIISLDTDPINFINLTASENNYEASVVRELILSNKLVGNFVSPYIDLCVDSHDYIIDSLQTDIRLKIFDKISK